MSAAIGAISSAGVQPTSVLVDAHVHAGHGFYYSLGSNFYLQQGHAAGAGPNISASEFQSIEIYQLTELWTRYGNLTEIW